MTSTNRFLSTSENTHTNATEKTLKDIDEFIQSGNLIVSIPPGGTEMDLVKVNGSTVSTGQGNTTSNSLRINIASDDVNLSSIQSDTANIAIDINNLDSNIENVIDNNRIDVNNQDYIDLMKGTILNREAKLLHFSTSQMVTGDTRIIANANPLNDLDLELIDTPAGIPCSIVTDNIGLTNYDVEIKYYINSTATSLTSETITINGHNPIALSNNVYRIDTMRYSSSSTLSSSGNIFIYRTADGQTNGIPNDDVIAIMNVALNQFANAILYCPPSKTLYIDKLNLISNVYDSEDVIFKIVHHINNLNWNAKRVLLWVPLNGSSNLKLEDLHLSITNGQTISFEVSTSNSQVYTNRLSCLVNYTLEG
jgi:hypothetical protein